MYVHIVHVQAYVHTYVLSSMKKFYPHIYEQPIYPVCCHVLFCFSKDCFCHIAYYINTNYSDTQ